VPGSSWSSKSARISISITPYHILSHRHIPHAHCSSLAATSCPCRPCPYCLFFSHLQFNVSWEKHQEYLSIITHIITSHHITLSRYSMITLSHHTINALGCFGWACACCVSPFFIDYQCIYLVEALNLLVVAALHIEMKLEGSSVSIAHHWLLCCFVQLFVGSCRRVRSVWWSIFFIFRSYPISVKPNQTIKQAQCSSKNISVSSMSH
jgi:hypothetical protein